MNRKSPAWTEQFKIAGHWVKAHPFKAVGFTYLFTLLAGCAAAMADYWALRIALPVFIVVFVAFMLIFRADVRKLNLIGLLLACLLVNPVKAGVAEAEPQQTPDLEPAAAGGTVVGVVVIGGVIFSIWLYRFCQRHFEPPPPPPPPPEEEEAPPAGALPGGGTSAAAVALQSLGSCYELRPASVAAVEPETVARTVELSGQFVDSTDGIIEFRVSSLRTAPLTNWLTFEQFKEGWAAHGLTLDDHFTGEVRFGKNGRPSRPEDVPFSWDWETRTMTYDPVGQGNTHAVIIERSEDLRTWEPYLSTRMPLNQPVKLTDVSSSDRMFYRFR